MSPDQQITEIVNLANMRLKRHDSAIVTSEQIRSATERACIAFSIVEGLEDIPEKIKQHVVEELECRWHTANEEPSIVHDDQHRPWLPNAKQVRPMPYWDRYREYLGDTKGLPKNVVAAIDDATDKILDHTSDPESEVNFDKRGMVVGHVQSGKTANYTGLICKAVDMGYRIVIVIAGLDNALRKQTQLRLNEDFIGKDHKNNIIGVGVGGNGDLPNIIRVTDPDNDFNKISAQTHQHEAHQSRLLFVVKKNVSVLKNLNDWLKRWGSETGELTEQPMLVIDDEADHASINTKFGKDDETDPSATNAQIRKLLTLGTKTSFVAYTATPFANIFIDRDEFSEEFGEDLFPRNFIIGLEAPDNYLGGKRVFLGSTQHVKEIVDHNPFVPLKHKNFHDVGDLPKSIEDAIYWYILSTATRKIESTKSCLASSMLIHVSRFKSVQNDVRTKVRSYIDTLRSELSLFFGTPQASSHIGRLHGLYQENSVFQKHEWGTLLQSVSQIIKSVQVKLINGDSDDSLDYEVHSKNKQDAFFIAVGGQTLARGLTLEGLVVSYFLRNSKAYDTLMQMGRWFGYREGYLGLVKIWMPQATASAFKQIATATDELFQELRRMNRENLSPDEFGLRVQTDPGTLQITARNKQGFGEDTKVEVSLEGKFPQAWKVHKDQSKIDHNIEIGSQLLEESSQYKLPNTSFKVPTNFPESDLLSVNGSFRRNVPSSHILQFLRDFQYPFGISAEMHPRLIAKFIAEDQNYTHFDLYVPTLDISPDGNPLTKSDGQFKPATGTKFWSRTFNPCTDPDGFLVTVKSNILPPKSDGDLEALGLDLDVLKMHCDKDKSGKLKSNSTAARAARQGLNPLMMLFFLTRRKGSCSNSPELVCTFGISFPRSSSPKKPKSYRVNRTYMEQWGLFNNLDVEESDE